MSPLLLQPAQGAQGQQALAALQSPRARQRQRGRAAPSGGRRRRHWPGGRAHLRRRPPVVGQAPAERACQRARAGRHRGGRSARAARRLAQTTTAEPGELGQSRATADGHWLGSIHFKEADRLSESSSEAASARVEQQQPVCAGLSLTSSIAKR